MIYSKVCFWTGCYVKGRRVEVCSRAAGLTRCAWIMKQCLMAQQEYGFCSSQAYAVSKFGLASIQQKRSTEKDIIWGSI